MSAASGESTRETAQGVPGFEVLRRLGQGGMGQVYLARQVSLDREVALKVLLPSLVRDGEFVERFHREAQAAALFSHPNIVGIIDKGFDPQRRLHYIAFDYLEGGSLEDRLAAGPLDEPTALRIACDVAQALAFAESKGLVHRDVKPENILFDAGETAQLADLGLAKQVTDDGKSVTQTGIVLGTPTYMAPEQALGERALDIRCDIYALGLVLWRSLTGLVPFDEDRTASAMQILTRHLHSDLPDVRTRAGHVTEATARLIGWMSARDEGERYPTAAALVADLQLRLAGQPPRGPAASPATAPTQVAPIDAATLATTAEPLGPRLGAALAALPWPVIGAVAIAALILAGGLSLAFSGSADAEAAASPTPAASSPQGPGEAAAASDPLGQGDPSSPAASDAAEPAADDTGDAGAVAADADVDASADADADAADGDAADADDAAGDAPPAGDAATIDDDAPAEDPAAIDDDAPGEDPAAIDDDAPAEDPTANAGDPAGDASRDPATAWTALEGFAGPLLRDLAQDVAHARELVEILAEDGSGPAAVAEARRRLVEAARVILAAVDAGELAEADIQRFVLALRQVPERVRGGPAEEHARRYALLFRGTAPLLRGLLAQPADVERRRLLDRAPDDLPLRDGVEAVAGALDALDGWHRESMSGAELARLTQRLGALADTLPGHLCAPDLEALDVALAGARHLESLPLGLVAAGYETAELAPERFGPFLTGRLGVVTKRDGSTLLRGMAIVLEAPPGAGSRLELALRPPGSDARAELEVVLDADGVSLTPRLPVDALPGQRRRAERRQRRQPLDWFDGPQVVAIEPAGDDLRVSILRIDEDAPAPELRRAALRLTSRRDVFALRFEPLEAEGWRVRCAFGALTPPGR